jgi:PAS domain S-box-containing protein
LQCPDILLQNTDIDLLLWHRSIRHLQAMSKSKSVPPSIKEPLISNVSIRELLRPFDDVRGILYIVKDRQSRVVAISPESLLRMGYETDAHVIGKLPEEYLPPELARKFRADDESVLQRGEARLNIVEMWFNPQGRHEWISTNKYPLRDGSGQIVGVLGILQNLDIREKRFAFLGPVGDAADYIRAHLGESLLLREIARHAGFSERQLQRNFRKVFSQTVQQYVIQNRIHSAIVDLSDSGLTLGEIALKSGFNDQSAFTNRFKKITGTTPKAYRSQLLGG